MAKKMLIDATHPEETRVVVVDGNKVDDFDYESINKRQLAGNIYLAKVTRVEPSLQAAFVEYGGNRHGFLAFAEVHPDYYQIPVADREALLAEEAAADEAERAQRDRSERGERPERAERPDRVERSERPARAERPARVDPPEPEGDAPAAEEDEAKAKRPRRARRRRGAKPAEASVPGLEVIDSEDEEDEGDEDGPVSTAIKGLEISDIGAESAYDEPTDDPISQARSTGAGRSRGRGRPAPLAEVMADPLPDAERVAEAPLADPDPVSAGPRPEPLPDADPIPAPVSDPVSDPEPAPFGDPEPGPASDPEPQPDQDPDQAPDTAEDGPPRTLAEGAGLESGETVTEEVLSTAEPKSDTIGAPSGDEDEPSPRHAKSADPDPDMEVESVGAEDLQEEVSEVRARRRRSYKIQDVLKVRQIMLVQVVKEERGNKGAALTTYLSLAGRYCVLMPNTARGGGISRKITQAADRKRLRDIIGELEVPKGMGLIVRTAGAERTRAEIHRDYEFLIRQWEQVRELTLRSIAPTLIYEEGSLIKRSIRDLYSSEIDTILVEGEQGFREARDYMSMLMPPNVRHVQQYNEQVPLFIRYQVESYLNGMFNPTVQLKSGGYIVIGITEALVAIDVNSGRSTKEGSIEETALKTNLEAADEVSRQLRLRDLAGLIVIDFIDMEESRNNRAVEKRVKDRLKTDRARIQIGRISAFGLMEMSRQRLRPGMLEASTKPCAHCHGAGLIRSDESLALSILREVEEEGVRARSAEITVTLPVDIANYLINQKRSHLTRIEERHRLVITVLGDPSLISPDYKIEKSKVASRPMIVSEGVVTAESGASAVWAEAVEVAVEAAPVPERRPAPVAAAPAAPVAEDKLDADGKARRRRGKRGGKRRRNGLREDGTPLDAVGSGQTDEATPDDDVIDADPPEPDVIAAPAPEPEAAPQPEVAEVAPKRRRSRKPAPEATEAAPEAATDTPAPAKRTRTRRKKTDDAAPEADAPVSVVDPAPVAAPDPAPVAVVDPAPVAVAEPVAVEPEPVALEVVAAAEPVAPEPVIEPSPAPEDPSKPKRRGWWALRR